MSYDYGSRLFVDATGVPVRNATVTLSATPGGAAVAVTDLVGSPIVLATNDLGVTPPFKAEVTSGWFAAGSVAMEVFCRASEDVTALVTAAQAAASAAQAAADAAAASAASAGGVTSVAGRSGAVTLTKADVGLSSVDNTADDAKPISAATQTALDGKVSSGSPVPVAIAPSGSVVAVDANAGGSFPARPTTRADVRVWWYGNANTTLAHAGAIAALAGDEYVPYVVA